MALTSTPMAVADDIDAATAVAHSAACSPSRSKAMSQAHVSASSAWWPRALRTDARPAHIRRASSGA